MKPFKLNKEFLDKWIEALESGEFPQGISYLLTEDDGYCCLGVALSCLDVDDDVLLEMELPREIELPDLYPDELVSNHYSHVGNRSRPCDIKLIDILINMNDGMAYEFYLKMLTHYEDLKFPKLIDVKEKARFDFKEIATFLRNNVAYE